MRMFEPPLMPPAPNWSMDTWKELRELRDDLRYQAGIVYESLVKTIQKWMRDVRADQQLEVKCLLSGGMKITLVGLGFYNPNMLFIGGIDDAGREVQVIAHVATVQIITRVVPNADAAKKVPIGFRGSLGEEAPLASEGGGRADEA